MDENWLKRIFARGLPTKLVGTTSCPNQKLCLEGDFLKILIF